VMVDASPPDTTQLVWDVNARALRPPRPGAQPPTDYFILGPLPLAWFHRAAALPGKALHVAVGLWFMKGLCGSATFPFKRKVTDGFGVSRDATYDALTNLEGEGLISVCRHRGRSPVVTILAIAD